MRGHGCEREEIPLSLKKVSGLSTLSETTTSWENNDEMHEIAKIQEPDSAEDERA